MSRRNHSPQNSAGITASPFSQRNTPVISRRARQTAIAATGIASMLAAGTFIAAPASADPVVAEPATGVLLAPYYTELDLTGDKQVTDDDLQLLADSLGATPASPEWPSVSLADVDADGAITLTDLAAVSSRIVYDDGPFNLIEASTVDMQAAMNAGVTTSVKLTQAYIDRIAAYDDAKIDPASNGRALNSIITTSTVALQAAAAADATRASQGMTSMLLGIPIAVKDNYDTIDMVTTGGCGCWNDNQTSDDAFMVKGMREAGAVILAKASLDEFAYGFASEFSSFQAPGTTTLVASPYVTSRTAGGSSGGTGAAIAANLAGVGFGTDTGGSIRIPSTYNQLVGIRPTVGLTSRDGIIPLALSQDTGGPITRSVTDAAVALDAVTGIDPNDPITSEQTNLVPASYTSFLDKDALAGTRIGFSSAMIGTNATAVRLWAAARATLEAQGATVVELTGTDAALLNTVMGEGSGSTNEFKHDLALYAQNHLAPNVAARSITQIMATGNYVTSRRTIYVQREGISDATYQNWAGPTGTHTTFIENASTNVTAMMDRLDLDTIVYPSGTPYNTNGNNMRLSPNTGMPAVTVPMGQTAPTDGSNAIANAGINLEFLGRNYAEGTIIGLGYAFEQATHFRTTPTLYPALG
jgi:amidase